MSELVEPRISSTIRGVVIGVLALGFGWLTHQEGGSFAMALLIAAALQGTVLLLRKFVPPDLLPQAMYLFELLADAGTVLLFALGVFGSIRQFGQVA
jgi:hypothetical protein